MYQVAEVCEEETLVPLNRSPSRKASTAGDYDVDGDGESLVMVMVMVMVMNLVMVMNMVMVMVKVMVPAYLGWSTEAMTLWSIIRLCLQWFCRPHGGRGVQEQRHFWKVNWSRTKIIMIMVITKIIMINPTITILNRFWCYTSTERCPEATPDPFLPFLARTTQACTEGDDVVVWWWWCLQCYVMLAEMIMCLWCRILKPQNWSQITMTKILNSVCDANF